MNAFIVSTIFATDTSGQIHYCLSYHPIIVLHEKCHDWISLLYQWNRYRHWENLSTGYLAKLWNEQGQKTQNSVQTGNVDVSEDIEQHRKIMGMGWFPEDDSKLTMPEIFSYPASPHLATKIDGREIDFSKIEHATGPLAEKYEVVLLEGAGGLMVPLTTDLLSIKTMLS